MPSMAWAFDMYYKLPRDAAREQRFAHEVSSHAGRLDHADVTAIEGVSATVCLTYEFDDPSAAEVCAAFMRSRGEHVEGPYDYG